MGSQVNDRTERRELTRRITAMAVGFAVLAAVLVVAPFTASAGAVADSGQSDQVVSSSPVSWTPQVLDGYVRTFTTVGNTVFSGGSFTSVQAPGAATPEARGNIVAFEKGTGVLSSTFKPSINGEVFKILPTGDGQTIFVAGAFSSVNGQTVKSIVKLDAVTGQRVTAFNPGSFDGRIHDLFLRNGKLIVTGRFNTVGGTARSLTAGLNPTTGALQATPNLSFTEPRRNGTLNIYAADITPDGSKMIAIGNFTKINGLSRYQIGMIDLANNSVANWQTNQYGDGCSKSFEIYMRDVEFSRDASYFVVVTTGAYSRSFLCDVAARWNTNATGSNLMPEWTNYSGGDTFTAVAITDDTVYVGGHQNYVNNPYIGDAVAAGAVPRDGLAALDPRSGATYSWNPGRERGWGVYGFQITDDGLWIGSDTELIAGVRRARQALMPIGGGTTLPADWAGQLSSTVPSNVVSLGLMQGGSGATLDRTAVHPMTEAASAGAQSVAAGSSQWRDLRGAFMIDGKLYTGWADKTFKVQSFDGTTFGPQSNISLQLDPLAVSLNRFATEDLASITGMFYEPVKGRIYFTKSGQNYLFWRGFSGESNIVNAERYASAAGAGGVTWSGVQSMFLANGKLYTADGAGNLTRRNFDAATGLPVTGTNVVVSGPAKGDGHDWRARDAFIYGGEIVQPPVNTPPVARIASSCSGLACSFDASGSTDADGTIAGYAWNFGDNTTSTVAAPAKTYAAAGTYTVTLTVTDNGGATNTTTASVTVVDPNTTGSVTFVAANSSDVNGTNVTVGIPASVAAGDRLVLVATQNVAGVTVPTPAGWTLLASESSAANTMSSFAWTKVATAADAGSNVTITNSTIAKTSLVLSAYRNAASVSSFAKASETTSSTQHVTPVVPVATAGSTVVSYWADKSSDNTGWTLPGGVTSRRLSVGSGSGRIVAVTGDTAGVPAGTGGGFTATAAGVATKRAIMWSFVLAPGGGPPPTNQEPTASFTHSCTGLTCSFDSSGSSDPDGTIASRSWTFGDNTTSTAVSPTKTYAAAGTYTVTLTVKDNLGAEATANANVTVSSTPPPAGAVAFRAGADAYSNSATPSVVVPASVSAGDQLVLIGTMNVADTAIIDPAGWTRVDSVSSAANTMQSFVWTKTATAADAGSTVKVANAVIAKTTLSLVAYSGSSGITAFAKTVDTVASAQHTTPTVPVATAGSTLVSYWSDKSSDNTGWTLPPGVTSRLLTVGSGSGRIVAVLADTSGLAAGTAGGLTATGAGAANKRAINWSIVLGPA